MLKEQRAFINNMKRIRREKNISQAELSRRIKKHRVYISFMEGASIRHKNPTLVTIVKIAKGLGVPPGDLLKEECQKEQFCLRRTCRFNPGKSMPIPPICQNCRERIVDKT